MAADPSEMTIGDRRNQRRSAFWVMLWVISLIGTGLLFRSRRGLVPAGAIYWLVAALPLVVAVGAMWSWARYLREADELQRRIQLNALAFGFGVSLFSVGSYAVLVVAGAPTLEPDVNRYMIPGVSAYFVALLYGKWQYR
jgi:hypothetical protein